MNAFIIVLNIHADIVSVFYFYAILIMFSIFYNKEIKNGFGLPFPHQSHTCVQVQGQIFMRFRHLLSQCYYPHVLSYMLSQVVGFKDSSLWDMQTQMNKQKRTLFSVKPSPYLKEITACS